MPAISDTPGPNDLFELAREYLNACKDAVARAPGGPIERCYISPGPPAYDVVPQLTVHVVGPEMMSTSPLGNQASQRINVQGYLNLVTLAATVLRPVPVVEGVVLPSVEAIEASTRNTLGDMWALWNHIRQQVLQKELFSYPDTRREVDIAPPTPVAISGGAGGWEFRVRVRLDGYSENDA